MASNDAEGGATRPYSSDFVGAIVCVIASVISNLGVNVQKEVHKRIAKRHDAVRPRHTKFGLWWCGLFLIFIGALGDFAAVGIAQVSLVAALARRELAECDLVTTKASGLVESH